MAIVWTKECDRAFEQIKQALTKETLLVFPDYSKTFEIHTDASEYQLGGVISQEGKPIAFYSRKLSGAQMSYTVGEKEMLSVVEMLKEYRCMLLGHDILVHTDHKNLTRATTDHQSRRIQRWRWIIEEYGPKLQYVQGDKNVVADALSRLDADFTTSHNDDAGGIAEKFDMTVEEGTSLKHGFPLSTQTIAQYQRKDPDLLEKLKHRPQYFSKTIQGAKVVLFHKRIWVPEPLRKHVLTWYHDNLLHPGASRLERTIRQTMTWPKLKEDVEAHTKVYHKCQLCKNPRQKYGHVQGRKDLDDPWQTVCVDEIGPYAVKTKSGQNLQLNAMTMCDPATGWFEIAEITNKSAETAALTLDRIWFSRYPRPERCIYDNGSEFLGIEFQEMLESYGIQPKPTMVKNPQANYVEQIHQTLGNMIRTYELHEHDFDSEDPWSGILANCAFAIRSTINTISGATPAQLVFGRDMLFDLSFTTDWAEVKKRKRDAATQNMNNENRKRRAHTYEQGQKVLLSNDTKQRKMMPYRTGPYEVLRVYSNGTLKLRRNRYNETVSIRRCTPYFEA